MSLALLALAAALVVVVAAVATGRIPAGLPDAAGTGPRALLAEGPVTAEDLDQVRFTVAVRGYRMDEVDAVLDRLRHELADRDARLAAAAGAGQD